jgi:hypothetical protein
LAIHRSPSTVYGGFRVSNEIAYRDEITRLSTAAEMKLKLEADLRIANDQISSLTNTVENRDSRIVLRNGSRCRRLQRYSQSYIGTVFRQEFAAQKVIFYTRQQP